LITKSGSIESGDIPKMVTIHTNPGYDGNPGHAGTGTVTSVVCGGMGPQHAVVTTNPATNLTTSSAKLNGSLQPHGLTTTVYFQWGTTTSYGHTTATQTKTGNTSLPITANISALTTHHTYHYRIVATNSAGTRTGSDLTFSTP
jgi:ribonuclease HI